MEPSPSGAPSGWRPGLSTMIFLGLLAGIACGLFFGEYCSWLSIVGEAFIGLLRMTVLPFIVVSLIANLGKLTLGESGRLARIGGLVMLLLWGAGLLTVFALPACFPEWKAGSFFSTSITDPAAKPDLLSFFIPSNIFRALAENHVPAVVLMSICLGLALSGVSHNRLLIDQLDVLAKVLLRVSGFVARLAPIGVFAISASTAGTISFEEVVRLQAYFLAYTGGALLLGLVVLPLMVTTCTPFTYREVFAACRAPMLTAFATGKLIIVLPMLIEETEKLFERHREQGHNGSAPAVDVLIPVAYSFPHVGKLLGLLFIPFAAWFLGSALPLEDYPTFLLTGLAAYFGGPVLATPYLLDQMHLPHDMFQLFLLSGVYAERLGDALGVMHLAVFTLLTTSVFTGRFKLRAAPVVRYLLVVLVVGGTGIIGMRALLSRSIVNLESRGEVIARMQLLESPVESELLRLSAPNPDPLLPGETLLQRVRRRGVLRVGYNEDKMPFAFYNAAGELVGFDINMAHALAHDLGVRIEFVRFDRRLLAQQLDSDYFDVVMSGLTGTLERAEAMQHTNPYMDVTLAFVVPDFDVRRFRNLAALRSSERPVTIGFVDLSRGFVARLKELLPNAKLMEIGSYEEFFEHTHSGPDALLISAESGAAFTLLYPQFEVVVPTGRQVSLPLFYAIGANDADMRDFLEYWITLRRIDGTFQEFYDYWVLGKPPESQQPRWSVLRDVLGWGKEG